MNNINIEGEKLCLHLQNKDIIEGVLYSIDNVNFEYILIAFPRLKQQNV
jgi:hypothetical protein